MTTREMLSVGIDVGTTTSQVVLSRLSVSNQARMGLVPRLDIESREVLHQSEPHLTPLTAPDEVDVDRLTEMVRGEYAKAGVEPAQVETGAVIITGETARTKNAEQILQGLGDLAGDFVVTVAGPNLESQMAARGSGAAAWSAANFATAVNVDIGGGSSNAAMFRNGAHIASSASMVGGRQAILDRSTGELKFLAHTGRLINDRLDLGLRIGQVPAVRTLRAFTDAMADIVVALCLGESTPLGEEAALSDPLPATNVGAFFVSGGVGALFYSAPPAETIQEIAVWGDVGPLLALSLREHPRWRELRVERPTETLRATVMGAASQQVSLSGSTIWAEPANLPLKNVPVIEPRLSSVVPGLDDAPRISEALAQAIGRWDRGLDEEGHYAISLQFDSLLDFNRLRCLASGFVTFAQKHVGRSRPLILVMDRDYAQVIGQTIKQDLPDLSLIVIDQVQLGEGDFIDIGEPLFDGRVVPVSVKTLVFYQAEHNKTRPRS